MDLTIYDNVMGLSLHGSAGPQSPLAATPALHFIGYIVIWVAVAFFASKFATYGAFVLDILGVVVFLCYIALMAVDIQQDPNFDLQQDIVILFCLLLLFILFRSVLCLLKNDKMQDAEDKPQASGDSNKKQEHKSMSTSLRLRINLGSFFCFDFDYAHEKSESWLVLITSTVSAQDRDGVR